MIHKFWWRHIQLFLVGTLIVALLQSCHHPLHLRSQVQSSEMMPSGCHTMRHEFGETCIPPHPQRIITMEHDSLEVLVALGLKPIASAIPDRTGSKTLLVQDKIGTIVNLGRESQPNLERMIQLKPDLILGMSISPQMYSLLSRIAPTVSIKYTHTDWKKTFQQIAAIVDRRSTADEVLLAYQNRLETVRSQVLQNNGQWTLCVMRFYTTTQFNQFFTQNSFAVSVLDELGVVTIPDHQRQQRQIPNTDWGYFSTSLEQIDLLEADYMFVAIDPGADFSFELYKNSPLWQTLNVVKQNNVYIVDSGHWVFGNILSANAILDDIIRYLLKENPS